ncbi:MAG TPA: glutamate-1-semialdehyde 2,1-aminomutase [Candidatus Limnocylindria bacterium]|nr:glutamate-1-semialdehyde 2,1-aminomutase [Candidatus Limnocylindria bacterium]
MGATRSAELMARAEGLFPGGVNSPVRAFRAVGGTPRVIERGAGPRVWDADGNDLVDYVGSWGAAILGHAHPAVVAAISEAAALGASFGMPTPGELELGEAIRAAVPSIERLRFVSSGTEAVMSAVRLARAATGRPRIVKMAGAYHGHADALLVRAGSSATGLPASAGVTQGTARDTLVVPYNDLAALESVLLAHRGGVAAILVEPVAANMGVVPPRPGYLAGLRRLADRFGALLVFDEVITGFRVARGGAQERYAVRPDLTVLGKIIGGGMPVAAYGGRRELMELVAPLGPVYQAGTLSGNPVGMAAGIATIAELTPPVYARLEEYGQRLEAGVLDAAAEAKARVRVARVASLLTVFFEDDARFGRFFAAMLHAGVHLPPSPYEAWFISAAHRDEELRQTLAAARSAFAVAGGDG